MIRIVLISILGITLLTGCLRDTQDDLDIVLSQLLVEASPSGGKDYFTMPSSTDYSDIPQDPRNKLTKAKVELGKMLYHETGLAQKSNFEEGMMTYSCASCHIAGAGFTSGMPQGIGDGGSGFGSNGNGRTMNSDMPEEMIDAQAIKTPSTLNVAYQSNLMWNGQFGATAMNEGTEHLWKTGSINEVNQLGYEGVESQAIASFDIHRMEVNEKILEDFGYIEYFDQAFPDVFKPSRYNKETAGKAIAAYERTLMANQAPFQDWLNGRYDAMLDVEKRGAILFFGKGDCVSCHTGPGLNSMEFHALGMADLYECDDAVVNVNEHDPLYLGRASYTLDPADNYKFKVPQLYNLKDARFYGHGSSFTSIEDVVKFKNRAKSQNNRVHKNVLSDDFNELDLTEDEIASLAYFVKYGLYDKNLDRYKPQNILSDLCFPNNDKQSKKDLGCE